MRNVTFYKENAPMGKTTSDELKNWLIENNYNLFKVNILLESFYVIEEKPKGFYYGKYSTTIRRVGNRYFKKTTNEFSCTLKDGKFYGNDLQCYEDKERILSYFFLWTRHLNIGTYAFINKRIIKSIFNRKIYNEETLYRSIANQISKEISWRNMRAFADCGFAGRGDVSIYDLVSCTTNVNEAILRWTTTGDLEERNLIVDYLRYAIWYNEKWNPKWSFNRLTIEHQKQIDRANMQELASKDNSSIYPNPQKVELTDCNVHLLDTELDVYKEGVYMHHCLYRCYWQDIRSYNYMAFHITTINNEEFTLGCHVIDNKLSFNQAYKMYDEPVSDYAKDLSHYLINHLNSLDFCKNLRNIYPKFLNSTEDLK